MISPNAQEIVFSRSRGEAHDLVSIILMQNIKSSCSEWRCGKHYRPVSFSLAIYAKTLIRVSVMSMVVNFDKYQVSIKYH